MTKVENKKRTKLQKWGLLLSGIALTGILIFVVVPWVQSHIPFLDQMVKTAKERKIDPSAYFYSESQVSYDSESYIKETIEVKAPDQMEWTFPLIIIFIVFSIVVWVGHRYLPP